jgi:hypothetical protein
MGDHIRLGMAFSDGHSGAECDGLNGNDVADGRTPAHLKRKLRNPISMSVSEYVLAVTLPMS